MNSRFLAAVGTLATFTGVVWLGLVRPAAQVPTEACTAPPATTTAMAAKAATWNPPRTPDGQPDLQGIWTNSTESPLERPVAFIRKEFFTEADAAAYRKLTDRDRNQSPTDIHYDNVAWLAAASARAAHPVQVKLIFDTLIREDEREIQIS